MEVFTEVNRIGMDAYDELAEGGNLLNTSQQTTTTAPGASGSSAASGTTGATYAGTTTMTATPTGDGRVREPTKVADPFLADFVSHKHRDALVHEFDAVRRAGGTVLDER